MHFIAIHWMTRSLARVHKQMRAEGVALIKFHHFIMLLTRAKAPRKAKSERGGVSCSFIQSFPELWALNM
jgi:hypothetical protein